MKDISNIIKEFLKLLYKGYVRKRPKHEPTNSYFYPERKLAKCMVRADSFNSHVDPVRTEMTVIQHIPISHIFHSDESKSKGIIEVERLLRVCSKYESK